MLIGLADGRFAPNAAATLSADIDAITLFLVSKPLQPQLRKRCAAYPRKACIPPS